MVKIAEEMVETVDAVVSSKVEVKETKIKQKWARRGAGWGVCLVKRFSKAR